MTEEYRRIFRKPAKKTVQHEPEDVHDNSLQRLSVYIQLRNTRAKPSDTLNTSTGQSVSRSGHGIDEQGWPISRGKSLEDFTRKNTIIVMDSAHKADAKDPLIAGKEPWMQLVDATALSTEKPLTSTDLAISALQLTFEAVASRWSYYIFHMHNYIASLEEQIYTQPADDRHSSGLWSVSKQLLQAERLLKFHILLLENVQNDLIQLAEPDACGPDWLRQSLNEFTRLSSEVEETLKKPVAHMVDLVGPCFSLILLVVASFSLSSLHSGWVLQMYKSISIRDARRSLELNTSLWRLSWITFVFLPLTFLASFFGMNVAELRGEPSLKW